MKFTIALTAALTSLQVVSAQNAATAKRAVDVSRAEEGQIFELREIPANEENESTEEDQGSDGTETAEEN
ncbi:hypothetical protein FQN54_001842 [Arachnomyces sp. PD_36]|nr:hypothetical protein FQN54_001842 [Arachnomyces sp. PD_36]